MKAKWFALCAAAAILAAALPAAADPCGMVPPIQIATGGPGAAIKRIGAQKTYVAYSRGMETMVLRPGFEGKVEEFGMLIPFPSAPAIRKVDDNIFPHIAAAVDPPEVLAYVRRPRPRGSRSKSVAASEAPTAADEGKLKYNEVRVVNREAVGMYDVAVLEAGSPAALERWMDSHKFKYPDGMDDVVQDYVDARWMFVAVKTRVGKKDGVNPRPGMRQADSGLPQGSSFNGHVQAMGFRFKTEELVIPMRLSAFNEGKLRNIVYALTDDPVRLQHIPKRFVRRQLRGRLLYRNLTGPLPLRVIGGKKKDLSSWQRKNLKQRRNPEPHNGLAKHLFAGDLLAMRLGRLANPEEEKEKQLLNIGERLGLRGKQIDDLHRKVLGTQRDRSVRRALKGLRRMTMTVIDGEFDRDTLAKHNLRIARYRMPIKRNNRKSYDSLRMGPGQSRGGTLYLGSLDRDSGDEVGEAAGAARDRGDFTGWARGLGLGAGVLFLGFALFRRSGRRRLAVGLCLVFATLGTTVALAGGAPLEKLLRALDDPDRAQGAVEQIVGEHGQQAVHPLLDQAVLGDELTGRGWAIVALAEIGNEDADKGLRKIHQDTSQEMLVRTWAAAARIHMAESFDEVMGLSALASSFPALQRPLRLRLAGSVGDIEGTEGAERAFTLVRQAPQMAGALQQKVLSLGPRTLTEVMFTSDDVQHRRYAASYLATLGRGNRDGVARAAIRMLRFRRRSEEAPWSGGALFLPGIQWNQTEARLLADRLIRWMLWAELRGKQNEKQQIHNNLRSISLANAAGYQPAPSYDARAWLTSWKQVVGAGRIKKILVQQRAHRDERYRQLVD